jgi:hypothetical protein
VLRSLDISIREILHFGKSGLGFLVFLFSNFSAKEKAIHVRELDISYSTCVTEKGGHTCGTEQVCRSKNVAVVQLN